MEAKVPHGNGKMKAILYFVVIPLLSVIVGALFQSWLNKGISTLVIVDDRGGQLMKKGLVRSDLKNNVLTVSLSETEKKELTGTLLHTPLPSNVDSSNSDVNHADWIEFISPVAFQSHTQLEWSDLNEWEGYTERRVCSDGRVYDVRGRVTPFQSNSQVAAEIFVPEMSQWYPCSGGGLVDIGGDGQFTARFCMAGPGPDRTFRFQLVHNNARTGSEKRIHIRAR